MQKQTGPNRLIDEKSPYLLQHAQNPVDWHPWGDHAFQLAATLDRPVFLSIGYSTCHWCHVMAHESFEDAEVARLMNDAFVNIKVDREERPDIDSLYMTACQLTTGAGGWPLTIIMTPEMEPFFAGTYFPKESRHGRIGMLDLVARVKQLWAERRGDVFSSAKEIAAALQTSEIAKIADKIDATILQKGYEEMKEAFDHENGGFGSAPKFPTPHKLSFLLRYWARTGEKESLEMAKRTLLAMSRSGLFDQIGSGFHRYSTDAHWLVPHFEKMLYDQALLLMAYTDAFQVTKDRQYQQTATRIIEYVLRDLTSPDGVFCSAEDADSEGEEGKFYIWFEREIRALLPPRQAELFCRAYQVKPDGNFFDEATGQQMGKNVLHLSKDLMDISGHFGMSIEELHGELSLARSALFHVRERRVRPSKDDKILVDWNGLMIAALAKAARVFDEPSYAESAKRAVGFITQTLFTPEGRLFHRFRDGEASIHGFLDDYAFLIWGLLELYESVFDPKCLKMALELNQKQLDQFWDGASGGLFISSQEHESLIVRKKEIYDGAIPSGNSVAMSNLIRLARITGRSELGTKAEQLADSFGLIINQYPSAHAHLLTALERLYAPSQEVVIIGDPALPDTVKMLKAANQIYAPNRTLIFIDAINPKEIHDLIPFTKNFQMLDGKTTAYVCRNFSCQRPTTDPDQMMSQLRL